MSLECGCGCGGHGNCATSVPVQMPRIGGTVPKAYVGLGCADPSSPFYDGDPTNGCGPILDVPSVSSNPITQLGIPPAAPIPSANAGINWNPIIGAWTQITGQILKSSAGANPTYQQIGPGGSTTIWGGNLPTNLSLPSPIGGMSMGMLLAVGLGALLLLGGGGRR